MNNRPLLSIISVTYNDFKGLKKTYESLKDILNENIEWIIKDGGSNPKERKKLEAFIKVIKDKFELSKAEITYISSKDNGIYNGMNFCLNIAKGEWLIFMNGGDEINSPNRVFKLLKKHMNSRYKLILGSTYVYTNGKKFLSKVRSIKSCLGTNCYRMAAMHQSQIFHREIYNIVRFRTRFKISADHVYFWESIINLNNENLILIDHHPISNFYNDGLSSKNSLQSLKDIIMSMITIQKVPLNLVFIASMKRLLAIFYFSFRSIFSR